MIGKEDSVVRVGDGRGFVVTNGIIVTAAHCLPTVELDDGRRVLTLPPHRATYAHERTFRNLVGPLGDEPTIAVECIFADPIADVALLWGPGEQVLHEEREAWRNFIKRPALEFAPITPTPVRPTTVRLLDLTGEWYEVDLQSTHTSLFGSFNMKGGMSGSPFLDGDDMVVGLVSIDRTCPRLPHTLPLWVVREQPCSPWRA